MKAKLSKEEGWYDLYRIDEDGKKVTFASTQDYKQKLSLKNCQAIENGYDLDELVEERFGETFWHDGDKYFKEGFQKALEILGDKNKKNIELLKEKLTDYFEDITDQKSYISEKIDDILQQTEWDVIVDVLLTERHGGVVYETPKLDADGCLILKT